MSVASVRSFVYRVIDIFPGPLKTPARWVADRVFGVWEELYNVLSIFRPVWLYLQDRMQWFMSHAWNVATATATAIRWLVTVFIPRWATWALASALYYADLWTRTVRDYVLGVLATVQGFLQRAIDAVAAFARQVLQYAIDRLVEVWNTLTWTFNRVYALLTNPEAFVDWVFDATWRRFWRFLDQHAESIGAAVWARRDKYIMQAMTRIEAFLMRIL